MKKLVLLNSPILTNYGKYELKKVSIEEAKEIIHQAETVESSIGHNATAEVITKNLDFEVRMNRIEYYQEVGALALVFILNNFKRLEEGQVLKTVEDIEKIGFEFGLLKRTE